MTGNPLGPLPDLNSGKLSRSRFDNMTAAVDANRSYAQAGGANLAGQRMTPVRQGRRAGESTQQVRERAFEAVITGYTDSDRKWRGKIIRSVTFNAGGGVTFDLEPDEVAIEPRKGVHDDKPLFGPHPTMPNVDVTYFVPAFVPQSDAVSPYTDSVVPVRSYSVIDQDGQTVEVWKCDIGLSFVCAEAAEPGTFGDGDGGGPGDGSDPIATDPGVPVPPGGLGPGGGTVG